MTARRVSVKSLAKINLDLRVLHQRPDGFHELRTVFQTISLADTIEIVYEPARRGSIELDDPLAIPDNLVIRAARAVLDAMKVHGRVRMRLKKRIPMGGGLGGGSSNAAAVLLALPALAGKTLPMEILNSLGAALGSDVPFFLLGGTAVAVDRGTEIYGLPDIAQEPVLVVSAGVHVATGAAYKALGRGLTLTSGSLTSTPSSRSINSFQSFVRALGDARSARAASALSANDFEAVVFGQHPQLRIMQGKLRRLADGVRMTGSGSALFALFGSRAERDDARRVLEGDRVFRDCRVMPASLVSRAGYRRLWLRQLVDHLAPDHLAPDDASWPPRSRYAQ